jgi:hypothetical protein
MSEPQHSQHQRVRPGGRWACVVSVACFLRGLPLAFCAAPKTPLRVLCIIALDTLHVLRHSQLLPRKRIRDLATFVDFQACTNAAWDHKKLCDAEYQALRQRLEKAGLGFWIAEYLSQLGELESRRPSIGGDYRLLEEARSYREAVVRLSLATVTAIALNSASVEEEIRATHCHHDVETLFRIVMQCQIIDDVLDYTADLSAGLPSFLTASNSLPQAIEFATNAARSYAENRNRPSGNSVLPLRIALYGVTALTKLVLCAAHRRYLSVQLLRRDYPRTGENFLTTDDTDQHGF